MSWRSAGKGSGLGGAAWSTAVAAAAAEVVVVVVEGSIAVGVVAVGSTSVAGTAADIAAGAAAAGIARAVVVSTAKYSGSRAPTTSLVGLATAVAGHSRWALGVQNQGCYSRSAVAGTDHEGLSGMGPVEVCMPARRGCGPSASG